MEKFEYLIVGAGPSGVQLALFFEQMNRNYLLLEAGEAAGNFYKSFPRHRKLISINKKYTGSDDPEYNRRMDWNSLLVDEPNLQFTKYSDAFFPSADRMVDYLGDIASHYNLNIQYNTKVQKISKEDDFILTTSEGKQYTCKYLIMATGVSKSYVPAIPGIEHAEDYSTVSVDPNDFKGQKVLIIGKGNSAFETADNLMETTSVIHVAGPKSVKLAWKTHFVGHLRAVNNNFLDTYQLKSQNAIIDAHIDQVSMKDGKYLVSFRFVRADEFKKDIVYDRVITATGFRFDASVFENDCSPNLTISDKYPLQTCEWESQNVPNMYFTGTITQSRDYKKSTSAFIHGFRYNAQALHRILEHKNHGIDWPSLALELRPDQIMEAIIKRVNRTSALWQQFGFLGDVIVIDREQGKAHYLEEMPVDYAHENDFAKEGNYFIITLEYGPDHDKVDPFEVEVERVNQTDENQMLDSQYLHPVVRYYHKTALFSEHNILENLDNEWCHAVHKEPLEAYLHHELSELAVS